MSSDSPITLQPEPGKESKPSWLARLSTIQWMSLAGGLVALATSIGSCQVKQVELQAKLFELQSKQVEIAQLKAQQAAESQERVQNARREYLKTLNGSDTVAQARILRFIIATETDPKLCAWANQELQNVQATLGAETRANQQRVAYLTATGKNSEEAKLEIAVRSSEMARLTLAKNETSSAASSAPAPTLGSAAPVASVNEPSVAVVQAISSMGELKPAGSKGTKAECVGFCAQPARRCEAACAGDRGCLVTKCYPQEAQCREDCHAGRLLP